MSHETFGAVVKYSSNNGNLHIFTVARNHTVEYNIRKCSRHFSNNTTANANVPGFAIEVQTAEKFSPGSVLGATNSNYIRALHERVLGDNSLLGSVYEYDRMCPRLGDKAGQF